MTIYAKSKCQKKVNYRREVSTGQVILGLVTEFFKQYLGGDCQQLLPLNWDGSLFNSVLPPIFIGFGASR